MEGEFICKYCGAPLDLEKAVGGVVRCVYCNNAQTLPKNDVSPAALSFLRMGEHDLDTCNFDNAFTAYQKAAELDGEEPEAYFGMALAAFKVQFLKDEVNGRLQPICHEISEKSFSLDKNYLRALELATKEQKRVYREKAAEIDEIRDQFNELKADGVNYDCFLCVKVSDENGGTTQDSHEALRLYHHLKERGFHPFYSEEEIGSRTGSDYEALILYALYTSECMLLVCYNEEYLQTKWVKNEYTRFMAMIANEEKERDAITFVFKGKPIERLPGKSGKIQGIDLSRPDAYTRIDNFVESHTPEAKKRREEEKARKKREEEEARDRQIEEMRRQQREAEEKHRAEEEARNRELAKIREQVAQMAQQAKNERRTEARNQMTQAMQGRVNKVVYTDPAQFEIESGVLKRYKGRGGDVIIPDSVTSIGAFAFYECSGLTSITIPYSVTSIGNHAFAYCSGLTSITIPDSVTSIGSSAFSGCSGLTSITIPDSVTSIGNEAFFGCSGLTSITIPDSVTSIGSSAFFGCSGLTSITIPDNVIEIGGFAFWGCKGLKRVVILDGVKSIGRGAFICCSGLTSITIPDSVTSISEGAFDSCSELTSITVAEGNKVYRSEGNCIIKKAKNELILGCKSSEIPRSVTAIGAGAFCGCSGLTGITISNNITSLGSGAFYNCTGLTSIVIPKSVTSIGSHAFAECKNLQSVTIPKRFKGIMSAKLKKIFIDKSNHGNNNINLKSIQFTFTD